MAAPTSYTEETLAEFMVDALGSVADVLEWSTLDHVQGAIDDALLAYGVADVAEATDIKRLRAISAYFAWRRAVRSLVTLYDFSRPEGSYSRSQMLKGAREALAEAEADAAPHLPALGGVVHIKRVVNTHDPYRYGPLAGEWIGDE